MPSGYGIINRCNRMAWHIKQIKYDVYGRKESSGWLSNKRNKRAVDDDDDDDETNEKNWPINQIR